MKALIIDDDKVFAGTLARALARRGLKCQQAHSVEAARTLIESCADDGRPDIAVIDLKLGDGSGLQVLDLLTARLPDCRTLVLTGFSSIATAVEAIKRGAHNYLPKPANADEILQALEPGAAESVPIASQPLSVERMEWEHIQRVLLAHEGNISATARALSMHRRTLQRKLQKRPVKE